MEWDIESLIAEIISTISAGVPDFKSVVEPDESLPPSAPFCLVEHLGGDIEMGNIEFHTHTFRITAGVARNTNIIAERKAVRGYVLPIVQALRANAELMDGQAYLVTTGASTGAQQLGYGPDKSFVGISLTVSYQTEEGVAAQIGA